MSWQELERHIEDILRAEGWWLDRVPKSGDLVASPNSGAEYNVTAFAQELHKRLNARVVKERT